MVDVKKALQKSVILVHGNEDLLRRRALTDLVAQSEVDEMDRSVMSADLQSPAEWVAAAGTIPFLSDRRMVIVRQLLRQGSPSANAKKELAAIPPSGLLVLVADDEASAGEDRQRTLQSQSKSWATAVTAAGGAVLDCSSPDGKVLIDWVKDEAERQGRKMSRPTAEILVEMVGGKLSRGLDEVEKLVLYTLGRSEIREEDVRAVVSASREWNIFRLVDSVVSGNPGVAVKQLRTMIAGGGKAEETAFRSLFPQLSRQFKLIWQARMVMDSGGGLGKISAAHVQSMPEKPRLADEKDWVQRRIFDAARKLRPEHCERALALVADAEAKMKGQGAAYSGYDTLEQMVIDLARGA